MLDDEIPLQFLCLRFEIIENFNQSERSDVKIHDMDSGMFLRFFRAIGSNYSDSFYWNFFGYDKNSLLFIILQHNCILSDFTTLNFFFHQQAQVVVSR